MLTEGKLLAELSENSDMSNPLVTVTVTGTTAYQYKGSVKCNSVYFWRVQASGPVPSEWSATFSFKIGAAPASAPPVIQIIQTPVWVYLFIAIGALVWVCLFILLLRRLYW